MCKYAIMSDLTFERVDGCHESVCPQVVIRCNYTSVCLPWHRQLLYVLILIINMYYYLLLYELLSSLSTSMMPLLCVCVCVCVYYNYKCSCRFSIGNNRWTMRYFTPHVLVLMMFVMLIKLSNSTEVPQRW